MPIKKKIKNIFKPAELSSEELNRALYETSVKLQHANKELTDIHNQQKELFLNISHDLRAPVALAKSSIESMLIHQPESKEEIHKELDLVYKRISQMEKMVNDIFTLASIDAKRIPFHPEVVNLGLFLEDIFYMFEADELFSKRDLALDIPVELPYDVNLDPDLFTTVINNLFMNALKFTKDNDTIALSAYPVSDNMICIKITDSGIGIKQEHIEHIFDRSYMVEDARTPGQNKGHGLGLSIVKSIVELHDGSITCESEYGVFTSFFINIPIYTNLLDK